MLHKEILLIFLAMLMVGCDERERDEQSNDRAATGVKKDFAQAKKLTDEVVREKVREYYAEQYGSNEEFLERMNAQIDKARIITITEDYRVLVKYWTNISTPSSDAYVVSKYEAMEMEDSILTHAFKGLPPAQTDEEKQELIDRYLSLLQMDGPTISGQKVIGSLGEIEGYETNKLDPDVESTVRELYKIDGRIWIFYTYNRVGGVVTRYRFEFDASGKLRSVDLQTIGREIGDYGYLV